MTLLRISLAFTFSSTQDLRAPKWQNQDLDLGHELRTTLSPLYNGQTSSSSAVKETTVIYFFVYFAQNNRHLFYHTSRGQKPESRCKYSHPFSEDCRKEYFLSSQLLVVCLPSEDITVILMNTFIPWDHLCCHVGHHGKKKKKMLALYSCPNRVAMKLMLRLNLLRQLAACRQPAALELKKEECPVTTYTIITMLCVYLLP